jgi:hypothetical protein
MKPIQEMLGLRVEVELEIAHGLPAIGQKGDLLIELVTLRLKHFETMETQVAQHHVMSLGTTAAILSAVDVGAVQMLITPSTHDLQDRVEVRQGKPRQNIVYAGAELIRPYLSA